MGSNVFVGIGVGEGVNVTVGEGEGVNVGTGVLVEVSRNGFGIGAKPLTFQVVVIRIRPTNMIPQPTSAMKNKMPSCVPVMPRILFSRLCLMIFILPEIGIEVMLALV